MKQCCEYFLDKSDRFDIDHLIDGIKNTMIINFNKAGASKVTQRGLENLANLTLHLLKKEHYEINNKNKYNDDINRTFEKISTGVTEVINLFLDEGNQQKSEINTTYITNYFAILDSELKDYKTDFFLAQNLLLWTNNTHEKIKELFEKTVNKNNPLLINTILNHNLIVIEVILIVLKSTDFDTDCDIGVKENLENHALSLIDYLDTISDCYTASKSLDYGKATSTIKYDKLMNKIIKRAHNLFEYGFAVDKKLLFEILDWIFQTKAYQNTNKILVDVLRYVASLASRYEDKQSEEVLKLIEDKIKSDAENQNIFNDVAKTINKIANDPSALKAIENEMNSNVNNDKLKQLLLMIAEKLSSQA